MHDTAANLVQFLTDDDAYLTTVETEMRGLVEALRSGRGDRDARTEQRLESLAHQAQLRNEERERHREALAQQFDVSDVTVLHVANLSPAHRDRLLALRERMQARVARLTQLALEYSVFARTYRDLAEQLLVGLAGHATRPTRYGPGTKPPSHPGVLIRQLG